MSEQWSHFEQTVREDLKELRTEYLAERKLLIEAEHSAIDSFSKAMLTLSAAFLGFSLTLIRLIEGSIEGPGWLYCSWVCFAVAVLTTVGAFFSSHHAYRASRDILDEEYSRDAARLAREIEDDGHSKGSSDSKAALDLSNGEEAKETIDLYNRCSLTFLVVGIISLLVFCFINLPTDV